MAIFTKKENTDDEIVMDAPAADKATPEAVATEETPKAMRPNTSHFPCSFR